MRDLSTVGTQSPTVAPIGPVTPTLPPGDACAGNLIENGDFQASDNVLPWGGLIVQGTIYNDPLIPGNKAAQVHGRNSWAQGMSTMLTGECMTNTQWKFEMDVRILNVFGEGFECDRSDTIRCPFVQFQARQQDHSDKWLTLGDEDMEWRTDGWVHFSILINPEDWENLLFLKIYIQGGPDFFNTLLVDNVSLERFTGSLSPTPTPGGNGNNNQIHLSQEAASCWAPGSEIVITSNTERGQDYQLATIDSTDPTSGTLKLNQSLDPVSTLSSDPNHAVEVALLNRRIVFEADDSPNDDLIGGHLIIFGTPTVKQHLEGVEIRNFGQQGNLGRYPVHFHICNDVFGSIVKKNVV